MSCCPKACPKRTDTRSPVAGELTSEMEERAGMSYEMASVNDPGRTEVVTTWSRVEG